MIMIILGRVETEESRRSMYAHMPLYPEKGEVEPMDGQGQGEVTPGMGMVMDQEPEVLILMGIGNRDQDLVTMEILLVVAGAEAMRVIADQVEVEATGEEVPKVSGEM